MVQVLTRSRGATAVQHWAADFAERTLCGRRLVGPMGQQMVLPPGAIVTLTRACVACAARRQDAVIREQAEAERRSRGVWRTRNRTTGRLEDMLVADMADTHLVSAIALCRRRATEFGFAEDAGAATFIHRRWPAYEQLCAEALRRFGAVWDSMVEARRAGTPVASEADPPKGGRAIRVREET